MDAFEVGSGHDHAEIGLVAGYGKALELFRPARGPVAQDPLELLDSLLPAGRRQVRQATAVNPIIEMQEVPAFLGHEGRWSLCRGVVRHDRSSLVFRYSRASTIPNPILGPH